MHSNSAALSIAIYQWILCPTPLVRTHTAPSEHLLHAVPQAIRKTRLAWGARRWIAGIGYVVRRGSCRACRTIAFWWRRGVLRDDQEALVSRFFSLDSLSFGGVSPPPRVLGTPGTTPRATRDAARGAARASCKREREE